MGGSRLRDVTVTLRIKAADGVPAARVAALVGRLIEAGRADAAATVEEGEGDLAEARADLRLEIGSPEAVVAGAEGVPRCLDDPAEAGLARAPDGDHGGALAVLAAL